MVSGHLFAGFDKSPPITGLFPINARSQLPETHLTYADETPAPQTKGIRENARRPNV